jgi:hypothetical protein
MKRFGQWCGHASQQLHVFLDKVKVYHLCKVGEIMPGNKNGEESRLTGGTSLCCLPTGHCTKQIVVWISLTIERNLCPSLAATKTSLSYQALQCLLVSQGASAVNGCRCCYCRYSCYM